MLEHSAYQPRVQTASSGPGKCLCMKKKICVLIAMMCVFLQSKTLILAIENAVMFSYGSYLFEVVVQDAAYSVCFKGSQQFFLPIPF